MEIGSNSGPMIEQFVMDIWIASII